MKEEERGYLLNETGARKIAATCLSDFQEADAEFECGSGGVHLYREDILVYVDPGTLHEGSTSGAPAAGTHLFSRTPTLKDRHRPPVKDPCGGAGSEGREARLAEKPIRREDLAG